MILGSGRMRLFLAASLITTRLAFPSPSNPADLPDDAVTRRALDHLIEQYIRAPPDVIEQSLQALENKRAAEEQQRQQAALARHQQELLHDPASPVSGDQSGDVTVVEFFDYRCGYCKKAAGALTQLQQQDAHVRVVYKDFPILGEASELAAKAALASVVQGKHRAFHEALLGTKQDLTRETLLQIARDAGLDAERLERDMAKEEWQQTIDRNRRLAKDLGINGTPAFIVGDDLIPGALDLKILQDLVARRRAR